jgi:hypothetical protein
MLTPIKIDSQPNIIHKTIAILTKAGLCKNIYTVNFDTLLETALKKVNCSFKIYNPIPNSRKTLLPAIKNSTNQVSLFKLHGSINRSRSIFATLDKVGTPLDNFFKYSLNQSLNNEFMVFIGYKGADNDIKPILQKWLKNNPDSFLWNSRDKFGIDKDILTLINKKFLKFMDGKDFISQIYNYL